MTYLDSLISISITKATKTVSQRGFGTMLIVGSTQAWPDRVREYSDPSEMLTDGFTVNSGEYVRAMAAKAQKPTVTSFKIGRRSSVPTRTLRLVPKVITQGYTYAFDVVEPNGTTTAVSYVVGASPTVASICTGLVAILNPLTTLNAVSNTTSFDITASTAGAFFKVTGLKLADFDVTDITADPGLVADLEAIKAEDSNWYGFTIDSHGEIELKLAAAWAESQKIVFFGSTVDTGAQDAGVTTDVLSDMKAAGYARSCVAWHPDYGTGAAESALAILLANVPGSVNLAYKSLPGVTAIDVSTDTFAGVKGKNGNTYSDMGGNGSFFSGISPAGEFIDVALLVDWTEAHMQEAVLQIQQNSKKVPYTQGGAARFKGALLNVLQTGVTNGGYAEDPPLEVTAPNVLEASQANRNARHLPGYTFSARIAGAINTLTVTGTVAP